MSLLFTIYGFGEVGSLLSSLINSNFSNCTINVINTQQSKSGRIIDLEHAAACRNNTIHHNSLDLISQSEFIIYAAGYSNVHGESRNSVALKNKNLVYELFTESNFLPNAKIIAITNPVDPIAYWIMDAIKGKATVIGTGTALDSYRLKHILSQLFSTESSNVKAQVIGEHGQHMVPIFCQCFVNDQPLMTLVNQEDCKQFTSKLINAAYEIRETEPATKYGIAQTTMEIIHALLNEKATSLPISIGLPHELQERFECTIPLFVGLNCKLSTKGVEVLPLQITTTEEIDLKNAIQAINLILNSANE